MKPDEIKDLLIREIYNKRSFDCNRNTGCSQCGEMIYEADSLYFYGDKEKTCGDCHEAILSFLQENR